MKQKTTKTFLLRIMLGLALVLHTNSTLAQAWVPVGTAGFTPSSALISVMALDASNTPYIFYKDILNEYKGTVMKFEDGSWQPVGEPGFSSSMQPGSNNFSLRFDNNNIPYVAYSGIPSDNYPIAVMKFENNTWEVVAQFFSIGISDILLDFDSNNIPYLSYRSIQGEFVLLKFENNVWETVGSIASATIGSIFTFNNNNIPYVAFRDGENNNKATVMKFENGSWQFVGQPGFSSGGTEDLSLSFDSNNIPYIAYSDQTNQNKATVQRCVNNNWEFVGESGFTGSYLGDITIAFDSSDNLFICYREQATGYKAAVKKFVNGIWQPVGPSTGFSEGMAISLSFSIGNNGVLYSGYSDDEYSAKTTVMKFDPTAGVETSVFNQVEMYPNPASQSVTLTNLAENTAIKITDLTGKLIYSTKAVGASLTIDTTGFTSGLYLVELMGYEGNVVKKLVIK
ncbi:MAG: T9SS type A sorting domain-containing protein [Flavobacteriaceae bacterium]